MINNFYYLAYGPGEEQSFYIDDLVELLAFTGITKKDLVHRINVSKTNHFRSIIDNKLYDFYYFLWKR